jgi:hypothetical protein
METTAATVDQIVQSLNAWRSELVDNITDEPPFTDDVYGPVRNLPPLEGDDLSEVKEEIKNLLEKGWPPALVQKYVSYNESVCPFWAEDHAIKKARETREKAILRGGRQ